MHGSERGYVDRGRDPRWVAGLGQHAARVAGDGGFARDDVRCYRDAVFIRDVERCGVEPYDAAVCIHPGQWQWVWDLQELQGGWVGGFVKVALTLDPEPERKRRGDPE